MRRKTEHTDEQQRLAVAEEYYSACIEDLGTLSLLYKKGFNYPHNACMLMARA